VSALADHLVVVPVVLPLAVGALMLLLDERRHGLKAAIGLLAALAGLAAAAALVERAASGVPQVYALGGWPAPFGIVLVADRLAALMVLLGAVLALAALTFSLARWYRTGPHFHTLALLLLAGLNGAFLTGDLFNLFVFFELLLAASYGLALYGGGAARVRASLHYIVVNLAASLLFLVGASLMYGATGTLNMADLALRIPTLPAEDRALVEIAAGALGVVFLVKAAMWPLGFWLPAAYGAASAPAAALLAILSKVGVYALLRLWLLVFGDNADADLLLYGGMATLAFGTIGMLAAPELSRACCYGLVVSSGTLLAVTGLGGAALAGAALYYLVVSTLGMGAFFLLAELVERSREPGADILAVTAEAFGLADEREEPDEGEGGLAIPATMALLGVSFACAALVVAGLPPLPGFVAKFAMLSALLGADPVTPQAWVLLALLLLSSLAAVIAFGRAGMRVFWPAQERSVPRVRVVEMAPVGVLLLLCLALTAAAGPAMRYAQEAASVLEAPRPYIESVLPRP
jgi:multicomponent K+:H+ antiporter subunit D